MRKIYRSLGILLACASIAGIPKGFCQFKPVAQALYQAATIPDSLKEDANVVVRYSLNEKVIKGPGKTQTRFHSVVTVLNEKGDHAAQLVVGYDKQFGKVDDVKMLVYDASGKQIKKYSKSDMYDRSASDNETLASNSRMLLLAHTISAYPTTIEIYIEQTGNSRLDAGNWQIQRPEVAVQNSEYKVSTVPSVGFRYMNHNTNIKPVQSKQGEYDVYSWDVHNLKANKPEEEAPGWTIYPFISFATDKFEFDGIPGDFSTWQAYGKWVQALNADVNSLTPQREDEIRKMVSHLTDEKAKAKFLYEFMQKNMHYVSIQLGIGGLKPFPATFVDQKKYGDCKALSNYMVALLKAVNIPAHYAIIQGGVNDRPADPSFPSDPFNHIVVCVPFKGDTTWLECTSTTAIFGKLGTFTENRNALIVTESGGKLVNTPKSTYQDNIFDSVVDVTLDEEGGAKANIKIKSTGEYRDMNLSVSSEKLDLQKSFLIKYLNLKQPSQFQFKDAPDKDGVKELNIDLDYDRYSDVMTGDKRFYRPQAMDIWRATIPVLEKRKADYYFEHPMLKTCVTNITLPVGYEAETVPANSSLKFSYGSYEVNYVYNREKNMVVSTAKFLLTNHIIPAAKYTELQVYLDNIVKAQNKKLVIRKKA
jgi:hypothetical protein